MNRVMFGFFALLLLCGADKKKDPSKEDLKKFAGSWATTKLTYNGEDIDISGKARIKLVFKGNTGTVEADDKVKKEYAKIQITLDATTATKCIDIKITGGTQKGTKFEGIYELKGDKLKICVKIQGNDRPEKFESPAGDGIALLDLTRKKE